MRTKSIFIKTNGCPGRELDVSRLINYFELNGCRIAQTAKTADSIIFVTCGFEKGRMEECFRYIDKARKYKGDLIVAGCLPDIVPEKFRQEYAGKFTSTKNLSEIDTFFPDFTVKFSDISDVNLLHPRLSVLSAKLFSEFEFSKNFCNKLMHLRQVSGIRKYPQAYLRISQGCSENCAYCSFRKAIGLLKSKPLCVCLEEYRRLLKKGHTSFRMYADNVGAYGLDIKGSFGELLQGLTEVDHNVEVSWYIMHLHPKWVLKYRAELLARIKAKKITELLCPIQSGSARMLKLMNRTSKIEDIADCLLEFKKANPDLRLYTQIIVGFPTESEKDLADTLNFIRQVNFDLVMPFRYYDGPETKSCKMDGKIDEKTIVRRFDAVCKTMDKEGVRWFEV